MKPHFLIIIAKVFILCARLNGASMKQLFAVTVAYASEHHRLGLLHNTHHLRDNQSEGALLRSWTI